ncbi:hypothetical protein AB0P17_15620 [Streptomyces sp. NPDC088124]|uniref:hypothetical protein n=1 Tax=Streptomyces sp. NPDC088124 TaxID=3154654 RepID=UPI00343597A0
MTIGYAELPIPEGLDGPDVPAKVADLAEAIDPHLWQDAIDLADRNARYAGAPALTVVRALDGSVWLKTSSVSNTWATVYEPLPPWRTLSLLAAYQPGTLLPQVRVIGQRVHTRGRIVRVDGGLIVGTNGVQVGTLPDDAIPTQASAADAYYSLTGPPLIGAGRYEAWSVNESAPGGIVFFSQDGAQEGGTVGCVWIDISGSYWKD